MHLENVLSLFDGISCGQVVLQRAGHTVGTYIASEVDRYAISITQKNHPKTKQIGAVEKIKITGARHINLLWGGSPCQGFSYLGDELNFADPRSRLVFEFIRVKNDLERKGMLDNFLLENVPMRDEHRDVISKLLGVEPIELNSSLVSAQLRRRLYWTNIKGITQPKDKGLLIRDVLETLGEAGVISHGKFIPRSDNKSTRIDANYHKGPDNHGQRTIVVGRVAELKGYDINRRVYSINGKHPTLLASSGGYRHTKIDVGDLCYRKLTPVECERLQTLPDNYTAGVSDTQRYKSIGNGWTVDMIAHITSFIK